MIFPDLAEDRFGYINLNLEAIEWLRDHRFDVNKSNPLLDPNKCGEFISEMHTKFKVKHSYGGWLEDRSTLWSGSYLDTTRRYFHLGVDFNVPAGTRVVSCGDGYLVRSDSDTPEEYGWGSRVMIRLNDEPIILVYAHLAVPLIQKSNLIRAGDTLGHVGRPTVNGGWFPHLHVQAIREDHYYTLLKEGIMSLDGYGHKKHLSQLAELFPDPMNYISIKS